MVFFNTFPLVPFNANYYNHLNTICYITKLAYQKTYCNIELAFHGNFQIMKTSYRYQFAAVRLFIYFLFFFNLVMYIADLTFQQENISKPRLPFSSFKRK